MAELDFAQYHPHILPELLAQGRAKLLDQQQLLTLGIEITGEQQSSAG